MIGEYTIHNVLVTEKLIEDTEERINKLKKQERKNHLKELAKKKYPQLGKKIILATADAILITHYGKE